MAKKIKIASAEIKNKANLKTSLKANFKVVDKTIFIIDKLFDEKYLKMGGKSFFGTLEKSEKSCRYYKKGCLVYNNGKVYEIHGAIYEKWKMLGGVKWGVPCTDELKCSDNKGRFNHFNNNSASIYWTSKTGAHGIWGDIRKRWIALKSEKSYLGYPTSDESNCPDNGRVNSFEKGAIFWWSDTGALDINDVIVKYKGLYCFKETNEWSGSDEPYAIFGVTSIFATKTFKTKVYGDVDAGETRTDNMELYKGKPNGIGLSIVLMEHDHGSPEKARKEVQKVIQTKHNIGTIALGLIPVIGIGIAAIAGPAIQTLVPGTAKVVTDVLGFADDKLGTQILRFTAKEMILMARNSKTSKQKNIAFKFCTSNFRSHGGNYKLYFTIETI